VSGKGKLEVPDPEPERWRRLHLVGIGGAGMSGIAKLLLARGLTVTGSDLKWSRGLATLEELGASVWVGHGAEQLDDPDAVVVSSAIRPDNPEVRAAREKAIPVLLRAEVLAALMRGRTGVAVAGTHGKTTTTSMVSVMLTSMGLAPSFVIGGDLNESGSGAEHGTGEAFVAEADESDGSFLLLRPDVAVVTNVEPDHLDFYGTTDAVEEAFRRFAAHSRTVVACWEDTGVRRALSGGETRLVRYGTDGDLELRIRDVDLRDDGSTATIETAAGTVSLRLVVPGRHNVLNAVAALGVAHVLGLSLAEAAEALATFTGVRRRFERRGAARGAVFVDDYAHHPTEVAATLEVARMVRGNGASVPGRVVAVFQPHRYTRTQSMWR
jgi:UDP-N-acetylmuramate--alanine ligase